MGIGGICEKVGELREKIGVWHTFIILVVIALFFMFIGVDIPDSQDVPRMSITQILDSVMRGR